MEWDKNRVALEMRTQHRRKADLSFTGQRGSALWGAAFRHYGSYRRAVEAAGIDYQDIWRRRLTKWDKNRIARQLKKLSRSKADLSSRSIRVSHPSLFYAAVHWFGAYRSAIEYAGLDYTRIRRQDPVRWSREEIFREIRRMRRGREPLHHAAIKKSNPELMVAAYRYCGTYQKAIEQAGVDYEKVRIRPPRTWDRQRVINELKELHRNGNGLWKRAVRRVQPYLPRAAAEHFGSYRAAASAAGIEPSLLKPPGYRVWSKERVLEELRGIARREKQLALAPTKMRLAHPYLTRVAARRFGSYRKAVEAAGIDYLRIARIYTKPMAAQEVIAKLRSLQEKARDLRYSVLYRTDSRLLNAARRRFGNYELALRAAGIAYPPIAPLRHWTEELVLKSLNNLHRADADLRDATVKKNRLPLYEAARYYFGSYPNAVRVAKLDYDAIVRRGRKADARMKLAKYKQSQTAATRVRSLHSPESELSSRKHKNHRRHDNPAWPARPKKARGI